jgi:transcriptional regulator with XRE-family HTH domain
VSGRRVVRRDETIVRRVVTPLDLGAVVRAERLRRGLSQDAFGAMLGESRFKINTIENGSDGTAVSSVLRILVDLGVRLVAIPSAQHVFDGSVEKSIRLSEELLDCLHSPESRGVKE